MIRCNLPLPNLPTNCACGDQFSVAHALTCKKGGFIHQRHDAVKNLIASLLDNVCCDVNIEPELIPLTGEKMDYKTANTSSEARSDIKAKGFWQQGQTSFFDVRVTNVNSASQMTKSTAEIFKHHENEKKRQYLQRIIYVEHGTFCPLVFGTNGGAGEECLKFISALAKKLADKDGARSTMQSYIGYEPDFLSKS